MAVVVLLLVLAVALLVVGWVAFHVHRELRHRAPAGDHGHDNGLTDTDDPTGAPRGQARRPQRRGHLDPAPQAAGRRGVEPGRSRWR
ncbi:hypothetical protein [Actinosynnema sp. NPDC023587]|uniref:hypothetical protein n=1 Tax=Actinosynnema sp. NPDC023587 TaxID=3154695 RepID=UPI00340556A2